MTAVREKNFRRNLFICLATALGICASVEITCAVLGVAPLFTSNLPLNEKMRFIRDHRIGPAPVSVVSGASVALNDIDTDLLQKQERQAFINLGANGVSVPTAEMMYKQVANLYRVREVIFAASPLEMRDEYRSNVDVPDSVFRRYVLGRMTMVEEFQYRDMLGLMSYWKHWRDYHNRTDPSSMAFSETGAVPLDITAHTANRQLWNGETIVPNIACLHCVDDLRGFCKAVRAKGVPFTVVLGPIRTKVLETMADVRAVDTDRRARIRAVVEECGASFFDITEKFTLDDSCFANSAHLNGRGMSALTEQLARFRRGETAALGASLECGASFAAEGPKPVRAQSSETAYRAPR